MDNYKDQQQEPQPLPQANDDYNDDLNNLIEDKDTETDTRLLLGRWEKNYSQGTMTGTTDTETTDNNRTITKLQQQEPQIKQKTIRKPLPLPYEKRVFFNRKIFKYQRGDVTATPTSTTTATKPQQQPIIRKFIRKNNCNINLVKCNHPFTNNANAPSKKPSSNTTTSTQRKGKSKIVKKVFDLSKYRYVKKKC
ncbi:hypothetical protein ACFFRR_003236 [Megaselia abdita]